MSNPTLGDALHRMTDGVGELGDIDRALQDVRTRRIRITVGTLAATCLAILLVVVAIPTPASVEPAGPKPAPSPAVEVLQAVPDTVPSIAEAPLPEGADVAAMLPGYRSVVWASGMPRLVADTFHTYWTSLSPDGRYHARGESSGIPGGGDVLVVTDLTTGRELLREEMLVDGKGAQAPRFVWSGDSQRLFLVMIQTERQVPPGILHVWQRAGDTFQQVGKRIPLPGPLIGANEDGSVALVEDSGRLAKLAVDGGALQRTSVAYPKIDPGAGYGWQLGQGCWSEGLHRACWVRLGGNPLSTTGVGWVDTTTGRSTTSSTTPPGESTFAGWRYGDPVLLNSPNAEHAQLVVLPAAGQATLREFANPSRPSDAITWGVSVPDPGTWGAP